MSDFGFLSPWFLLAFPVMGIALAYAYRKHGRGKPVVVGTLLLLQKLSERSRARQRFSPPWRFFFELALLALLSLAAARLYRTGDITRVAIVVDNSFSMNAKAPAQESLFQKAKDEARTVLDTLPSRAVLTLYSVAPELSLLVKESGSVAEVVSAVDSINPAYAPDRLETAISRLIGSGEFDQIHIFTDRFTSGNPSNNTVLVHTAKPSALAGSDKLNNLAIEDVKLKSGSELAVSIRSFARTSGAVSVALDVAGQVEGLQGYSPLRKESVNVPALGNGEAIFQIQGVKASGFRVRLESVGDAIDGDNVAYFTLTESRRGLLIVSPGGETFGLEKIRSLGAQGIRLDTYSSAMEKEASVVIFHRCYPGAWPAANSFFILPPKASGLSSDVVERQKIEITEWEPLHPIIRYLNLPVLALSTALPLTPPAWSKSLISSTIGSLAFGGELNGFRYFAVGFEIFPFEGRRSPVTGILTLNALSWLSNGGLSAGASGPYASIKLKEEVTGAQYLEGEELTIDKKNGAKVIPPHPGIIALQSGAPIPEYLAVNYFDAEESDLLSLQEIVIPNVTKAEARSSGTRPDLAGQLAWLVLILIAVDMLVLSLWRRRRTA